MVEESFKEALKESFEKIKKDFKEVNDRISELSEENKKLREELSSLKEKDVRDIVKEEIKSYVGEDGRDKLEKEVVNKFNKNKKGVIKQKIIDLLRTGSFSPSEVKDLVVDEYKYCSKASFYRYFDEIKRTGEVEVVKVNEKEVVFPKDENRRQGL